MRRTCGQCDGGLVDVSACTCGGGPGYGPHEPLCGTEPCPSGCWWVLHPEAPGAPVRRPRRALLAERLRRASPLRRWRLRASKWHPGWAHDEVTCCYEEWLLAQPRWYRRLPEGRREELAAMPRTQRAEALRESR